MASMTKAAPTRCTACEDCGSRSKRSISTAAKLKPSRACAPGSTMRISVRACSTLPFTAASGRSLMASSSFVVWRRAPPARRFGDILPGTCAARSDVGMWRDSARDRCGCQEGVDRVLTLRE